MEKKEYKIVRRGERGASVTLPAKWLKQVGAKPGDEVIVWWGSNGRLIVEKKQ